MEAEAILRGSSNKRYYLYREVGAKLGATAEQVKILRRLAGDKFRKVNKTKKQQGRLDADYIDSLVPRFRNTALFGSCAWQFKFPLYAIDELCTAGLLEWEDHPAVLATRPHRHVRDSSVTDLSNLLLDKAQREPAPSGTVSLSRAAKRTGGRLKPWSCIIDALLTCQVPFWLSGPEPTSKSIRVFPEHFRHFDHVIARQPNLGLEHAEMLSQIDIGEVLNIKPSLVAERLGDFEIPLENKGLALVALHADVLKIASEIAWNAEIARHLAIPFDKVNGVLNDLEIRRCETVWCREALMERNILPRPPQRLFLPLQGQI